ncbi:hypothetical protein [Natronobiforma cellulositropha]|uniref:hypothetical protein n=1 Tax=Natronobiforma cellulositropha TaxID=1679076 RepID=UPI0021D60CEF|nr:hypothetical protein [Natronobiforma cellulositropha]
MKYPYAIKRIGFLLALFIGIVLAVPPSNVVLFLSRFVLFAVVGIVVLRYDEDRIIYSVIVGVPLYVLYLSV